MDNEGKSLKLWIIAGIIVVLMAAGWFALPAYRHFKEKRSAAEAQSFFDRHDYRNALLSARLALQLNSNNVTACRVMAGLADAAHSPLTLDYWQRVVKLSPNIDNRLALAAAGLRYQGQPFPLTAGILDKLSNSAARVPDFHIVSGELALALHNTTEAEAQFAAASQLAPTNQRFKLNLAVVRLAATNTPAAKAAAARATLKKFSTDPDLGVAALRSLLADRLAHHDTRGALAYSSQLLANPHAGLGDRLQNLDILKQLQSPDLAGRLKSLQQTCSTNAMMTAQVAGWMEANGQRAEATHWLTNLPPALQTALPVRLALANCYMAAENWTALRDFAAGDSWGDSDFLRFAFLSRAWSKLGEPVVAEGNWSSAVNSANNQLGALNALLQLAERWGKESEQEGVLRRILHRYPDALWAQHDLEQLYFKAGDTTKLYELYAARLPRAPKNVEIKNNLAATALLLKTNLSQAFQWAAEVYAARTNDAATVSTYAYALHLQGRDREGLAAMQKLKPAELTRPSAALYYGVLLSAVGEKREAAFYLEIARTKGHLLPEEKQLLDETLKQQAAPNEHIHPAGLKN